KIISQRFRLSERELLLLASGVLIATLLNAAIVLAEPVPTEDNQRESMANELPTPPAAATTKPPVLNRAFFNPGPKPTAFAGWAGIFNCNGGACPWPPDSHGSAGPEG